MKASLVVGLFNKGGYMPKDKKKVSKYKPLMFKGCDVRMVKKDGPANSYYDLVEEYEAKHGKIK